jgi:hypothetical protein
MTTTTNSTPQPRGHDYDHNATTMNARQRTRRPRGLDEDAVTRRNFHDAPIMMRRPRPGRHDEEDIDDMTTTMMSR